MNKLSIILLLLPVFAYCQSNVSQSATYNMHRKQNSSVVYNLQAHQVKQEIQQQVKEDIVSNQKEWSDKIIVSEHKDTIRTSFIQEDMAMPTDKTIILFDKAKSEIRPEFMKILDLFIPKYVKLLQNHKIKSITFRGFASTEGSYEFNVKLSHERAEKVRTYSIGLLSNQIAKQWLEKNSSFRGYGPSQPIIMENGQEDRIHSRRVEIDVILEE